MAYTIISQNNNTTTLTDGVNTITVPSRVNLTSGNFTIVEVNNNMATLEDSNGNVYRDIPCVVNLVDAGGGGGAVDSVNGKTGTVVLDAEDVNAVPQLSTMPTAGAENVGNIVQFKGATTGTYTNGYFYKCISDGTTPESVEETLDRGGPDGPCPATVTNLTDFVNSFCLDNGVPVTSEVKIIYSLDGTDTMFYENLTTGASGNAEELPGGLGWWDFMVIDQTNLASYRITNGEYGYIIMTYTKASSTYAWEQINVQPGGSLPSQTGNTGKFLTTDGTDASWSDKPLVNQAPAAGIAVASATMSNTFYSYYPIIAYTTGTIRNFSANAAQTIIGDVYPSNPNAGFSGWGATLIGVASSAKGSRAMAIGAFTGANANGAIQLNSTGSYTVNSDAETFKVANTNGNFEIMSADGTIPTDRYTTTPSADGTYYPTLTISSGTPTRSWSTISALQNTATGNQSFTVGGTPTNANYSMNIGLNSSVSGNYSLAIGRYATVTGNNSVVIGGGSSRGDHNVVLGNGSVASGRNGSIVIGNPQNVTPIEESNVAVFTLNEQNYKILDSDGSIPTDRLIKNSIPHYTVMPAASADLSGVIAQYVGATDGSYTNGYFYKCSQGTSSATASQTTGSSLSDVAVVVATFETQATDSGSYEFTYSVADSAWIHDYLIANLTDWGITYTGTPVDGDVITVVYDNGLGWTQTDVQPGSSLPSTTGLADGNYKLRLTMSNGTPTLTWVAE